MMCSSIDTPSFPERIEALDWEKILQTLYFQGFAKTGQILNLQECHQIINLYGDRAQFRSHVKMEQYRFGQGEYQYFAYPLPVIVQSLRETVYPYLLSVANTWNQELGNVFRFANTLEKFLETCHRAKQVRPTPLLLKYESGDFNCLHQDLYGELTFPLQMAILLSEPGEDFVGGEFVLVEQKPRTQSRVHVAPLHRGEAVIFAVSHRPVQGTRGFYRVNLKHGVSQIHSGQRYCLGIIFHDAT
ncbi:2OG-Fe(II) oxygenase [Nostoc sp. CENA67]|uniref:2OG-Fe(II) oxygenase n=1 Tax=Amazonocrinis nigriterrae CENA67 TaxID=2794033 RepID=A0A8J7HP49_9NOST|nr:2OG-Fe(II) oxygenase [Amazonocrinis nigriterrae]MBH8560702.1 2OG-Fe(II) oxygenase [Amazonocrinis nigriterrae CENA67]